MAKLTNVKYPSEIVEIGGVTYRKVNRAAKAGDIVKITSSRFTDVESGSFYSIVDGDTYGSPGIMSIVDDGGIFRWGRLSDGKDWEVYEKVTEPSAQPKRLTVGDYAKVTSDVTVGGIKRSEVKIGEIRKIVDVDRSNIPFKAEQLDGKDFEWFREDALVRATEAEVEAARKEAAKKEAEQIAEEAKWAKIGRKVNEFKRGDLVRVLRTMGASSLRKGQIVEVAVPDGTTEPEVFVGNGGTRYAGVELIIPVEQRFDLQKEAA